MEQKEIHIVDNDSDSDDWIKVIDDDGMCLYSEHSISRNGLEDILVCLGFKVTRHSVSDEEVMDWEP